MLNLNTKREREELESTAVGGQSDTAEKGTNLYVYWKINTHHKREEMIIRDGYGVIPGCNTKVA